MVGRLAFPFGFRSLFRGELLNFGGVPFLVVFSQIYMLIFLVQKTLGPCFRLEDVGNPVPPPKKKKVKNTSLFAACPPLPLGAVNSQTAGTTRDLQMGLWPSRRSSSKRWQDDMSSFGETVLLISRAIQRSWNERWSSPHLTWSISVDQCCVRSHNLTTIWLEFLLDPYWIEGWGFIRRLLRWPRYS